MHSSTASYWIQENIILGTDSCIRCYFLIATVMTTAGWTSTTSSSGNLTHFSVSRRICLCHLLKWRYSFSRQIDVPPLVSRLRGVVEPDATTYIMRPSTQILTSVPVIAAVSTTEWHWAVTEHFHSLISQLRKRVSRRYKSTFFMVFLQRTE
jgi:hypothetical protein